MARIRTIKPEFWTDSKIVARSPFARLLFIGMWNFADDQGCIDDDPLQLKLRILPADDIDAAALVDELLAAGLVRRMTNATRGTSFLQIAGWDRHQRINRPSAPTMWDDGDDVQPHTGSPTTHGALSEHSVSPHAGREGKGKEGKNATRSTRTRAKTALPNDWHPNDTHQRIADELDRDLDREAAEFQDDATAHDRRYKDWDAAFRKWLRNERYRAPTRASPNGHQRLTAAEQRTQRNRDAVDRALANQRAQGLP